MINSSLDLQPPAFKKLLEEGVELIMDQFHDLENKKAYHYFPQREIEAWFDEPLPIEGLAFSELLQEVKEKVMDPATNNLGPYMYAYVMAGGSQLSIL